MKTVNWRKIAISLAIPHWSRPQIALTEDYSRRLWGFDEFPRREHRCTGGEEPVDQAIMEIGVEVGAAVFNDRQTEIGVGGFEQSGEDDAAGGDAVENQRVNVIDAEDHGEVGAGESADAMLGDDDFAFFRGDDSRDRSERFLKQFLMLCRGFNGAEENVSRTDLREPRTKADLDMDNGHAGGTRVIEDACGTSQEGVFVVFGVDGDDAGLAIHAQDGCVSRIDGKCSSHIAPRAAEGSCRIPS
jgi:hypothetical protein